MSSAPEIDLSSKFSEDRRDTPVSVKRLAEQLESNTDERLAKRRSLPSFRKPEILQ
jgi:hypothetical protein